jgi:hypothetical protein
MGNTAKHDALGKRMKENYEFQCVIHNRSCSKDTVY